MANILIILCLFCVCKKDLSARDFGVHGHTFAIAEEDFSLFIQRKLNDLTDQEVVAIKNLINNKYGSLIREPRTVDGLGEARSYKTYSFDPCITAAIDIADHENNVIVKKGTSINPLSICPMKEDLLFFDGSNENHLKWAKEQEENAKWILVRGRPIELEEREQRRVFFDQFGFLTTKLNIQRIPAKVSQNGELLKIEEIPLE